MEKSEFLIDCERSLIKKFRKQIWSKFVKGLQEYQMIEEGDKICVTISGGKDSLILAKLMQEIQRHGNLNFELVFIAMNPGFNEENLALLKDNCVKMGIPVIVKDSVVFEVANKLSPKSPCYMCARMRRGFLYQQAKDHGCNKMALGHHFNDVIETTMMNILYAGSFKTMVPKVQAENFEEMVLIRPMYLIKEDDIKKYMKHHDITTMACGCDVASGAIASKRARVKELIKELKEEFDVVDQNIFKSCENIYIDACLGYKTKDEEVDFNKLYERKK
ncbi:MAG: ATP-binding protein [bacterium]